METLVFITSGITWVLAWQIFRRKYRWSVLIEQSPKLNGKINVYCDNLPNEGVRIRIEDN